MKIKRFFKELFTAYYNPNQGIMNCEQGSFVYWHEYRHKLQFENKIINWFENWLPSATGGLGLLVWITAIMWQESLVLMLGAFAIMPISLFLFFVELDAWVYTILKKIRSVKIWK